MSTFSRRFMRSGIQSGTIMIGADSFTQLYIEDRKFKGFEDVQSQLGSINLHRNLATFPAWVETSVTVKGEKIGECITHGLNALKEAFVDGVTLQGPAAGVAAWNKVVAADEHNVERTLRWALVGATLHGPYFFLAFGLIDKIYGAATALSIVFAKTLTAQIFAFPVYLAMLFGYMGAMEKIESASDWEANIKKKTYDWFVAGAFYWPVANGVNFLFCPPSLRVPMVALSAGVWSAFLSWLNANQAKVNAFKASLGFGPVSVEDKK